MRETARMKTPILAAALLLLSCGDGEGKGAQAPRGEIIECATGGSERFERNCTMDYREDGSGLTVTVRNAQGGFRRLLLPRDGSGARVADGAEPATVTVIEGNRAEVAIAGDRYRLPATIGPRAAPKAR